MSVLRWLIAACAVAGSAAAHSHAFVERADPKVGSTAQSAPAEVRIWFSDELDPAFGSIEVTDANGRRVESGRAQVDAKDRVLLHVSLNKLVPGEYSVHWRIVTMDTHASSGRFVFRVAR
jgi:copper resistance protein C